MSSIIRSIYNLIFYLALPFILLRLLWRSRQAPAYRQRWRERLGFIAAPKAPAVWVHAVSYGEANVAVALIKKLQQQFPNITWVVTTMTVTGSQHITKALDDSVVHVYLPYDYSGAVKRFLKRVKPKLAIIVETELWPNILHYCQQDKIPVIIANARLSKRSAKGYARIAKLMQPMLAAIAQVLAQSGADADRFRQMGVKPECIKVAGNIKFDIAPPEDIKLKAHALRQQWGDKRLVWIAASTHRGEDEMILQTFNHIRQMLPKTLLILVPRHPERFDEVALLCQQGNFKIARRSDTNAQLNDIDIYLGDTLGDLWLLYAAANIAFVGGSLVPTGGHNLLEPAALSLPIITGPFLFNFTQIVTWLQQANALTIVTNASELANAVLQLLHNEQLRITQGNNAYRVMQENQGALMRHVDSIKNWIQT